MRARDDVEKQLFALAREEANAIQKISDARAETDAAIKKGEDAVFELERIEGARKKLIAELSKAPESAT